MKESLKQNLSRDDSLDLIQSYVEQNIQLSNLNKQNISEEMFHLFFNVIELGKEIRTSIKEENTKNSESKIADIFLVLISLCNNMNINLFDAIIAKDQNLEEVLT